MKTENTKEITNNYQDYQQAIIYIIFFYKNKNIIINI